jgi:isopentenyl-diphosphate delta-isomerase
MVLLLNGKQHDKYDAHKFGLPHYAFSVFIFNSKNELLMQKRAISKYHSGGLWSNTCCSHPLSNNLSLIGKVAEERLSQEMGIICPLKYVFEFEYKAQCDNLIENEYDYVFIGYSDVMPLVNPVEVDEYKWNSLENINRERMIYPQEYTAWFNIILDRYLTKFKV